MFWMGKQPISIFLAAARRIIPAKREKRGLFIKSYCKSYMELSGERNPVPGATLAAPSALFV